ncbi:MAG: hypothetical protein ACC700_19410 [Anaerolineales bacterium]
MKARDLFGRIMPIAAPIVLGAVLSSCEIEIDVDLQQTITIYRNEVWEAEMMARFAAELVDTLMAGNELTPESEQEFIQMYLPELEGTGVEIAWESQFNEFGDLIYNVHMEGQGLDTLKSSLFDEDTRLEIVEIERKRRVVFSHEIGYPESIVRSYTLTLIGGDIISSNGQMIDDSAVLWSNPSGRIEAVLTEKSQFPTLQILVLLGAGFAFLAVALLVIGGVVFYSKQRKS